MASSFARAICAARRRLVSRLLVRQFAQAGKQVLIADPVRWERPGNVRVGSKVFFGPGSYVTLGKGRLTIGSGVMFGPEAMIVGGDHNFLVLGRLMWDATSGGTEEDIYVEDDVWCGARVLILRGVTIGRGAVIGAASVVNRSLPPFVVAAGNPCRPRRR